jgi:glutamine synthetase
MAFCPRGILRGQQAAAEADGLSVLAAAEIEFVLFDGSGMAAAGGPAVASSGGPAYGLRPLMEQAAFLDDVHRDFDDAGLAIEQLHAEYGSGQIELSVAPAAPLQAADANVLARILLCRAARRHGLAVSFSPKVFAEGIGNGAHVHMSFWRGAEPLLSGGNGPHGLTDDGGAIIGGLVKHLPEVIGALAPSLLSDVRLQPGHWSGAFACWSPAPRETLGARTSRSSPSTLRRTPTS